MFETGITVGFEFKFEFGRFLPVTGPTGPVNRNRWPAVRSRRSDKKTLVAIDVGAEQARVTSAARMVLLCRGPETPGRHGGRRVEGRGRVTGSKPTRFLWCP